MTNCTVYVHSGTLKSFSFRKNNCCRLWFSEVRTKTFWKTQRAASVKENTTLYEPWTVAPTKKHLEGVLRLLFSYSEKFIILQRYSQHSSSCKQLSTALLILFPQNQLNLERHTVVYTLLSQQREVHIDGDGVIINDT